MRAVGAKLRTTPARKNRESVAGCAYRATHGMTASVEQMPSRKGQAVQIIDRRTCKCSRGNFAGSNSQGRLFGFPPDQEISVIPRSEERRVGKGGRCQWLQE